MSARNSRSSPTPSSTYAAALKQQPDYADAHYNLALVYERMGEPMPAAKQWRAYLAIDSTSPWAGIARQQLNGLLKITPGGKPANRARRARGSSGFLVAPVPPPILAYLCRAPLSAPRGSAASVYDGGEPVGPAVNAFS